MVIYRHQIKCVWLLSSALACRVESSYAVKKKWICLKFALGSSRLDPAGNWHGFSTPDSAKFEIVKFGFCKIFR